jgi:hypothetical protein
MSELKSIPISIVKSIYGLKDSNFTQYIFYLDIYTNNDETLHFEKIINKKSLRIIESKDKITYNNIKKIRIKVKEVSFLDRDYSLLCDFDNNFDFFKTQNKDIYIEFIKNSSDNTICNCRFLNKSDNLLISPSSY